LLSKHIRALIQLKMSIIINLSGHFLNCCGGPVQFPCDGQMEPGCYVGSLLMRAEETIPPVWLFVALSSRTGCRKDSATFKVAPGSVT
jgi:hypothetical protein